MHEGDDVFYVCSLGDADIAVSHEGNPVAFSFYDSVDYVAASGVLDKNHGALPDVFIFPWTQYQLITHVHDERVHAISFAYDRHGLAFRNQFADFRHH